MIPIYEFDKISPEQILNRDIQAEEDVSRAVDEVIANIRKNGDAALKDYTKRFDGVELESLQVTEEEIE
ncbi:MAG: histidinol dehydrogenase, partial [Oscillibacter sp.]|nr:histidinol dehydrogenase [Oscillibacter sp.]